MKKYLLALLFVCYFLAGCSNKKETETADYFFEMGISSWTYQGRFLQLSMQEEQIELSVTEVKHFAEGNLYELIWNCNKDAKDRYGADRQYLGLFLVLDDCIYLIRDRDTKEEFTTADEFKHIGTLVCSKYGKEDILEENERGWHEYILVEDNRSEYHGYNNLVETGYYECFVWEMEKGLIEYRSGYGAEADAIKVHLLENE